MGKSTTGIGMHDVQAMMSAIQSIHECEVLLTLEARTERYGVGVLVLTVTARFPPTLNRASVVYCTVTSEERDLEKSLSTVIYQHLHRLDAQIQQKYRQMILP